MAAGGASASPAPRYIVGFKAGADAHANAAVARARGHMKIKIEGMNALAAELSEQAVAELRSDPNIAYVEADALRYLPTLNAAASDADDQGAATGLEANPASGKEYFLGQAVPYGITMVQADQLPNGGARAGNRKVCIIDSGYDRSHEDLNHNGTVTGEFERTATAPTWPAPLPRSTTTAWAWSA